MEIKIYTSSGCGYCAKMKELLGRVNLEYTEYKLGSDIDRQGFNEIFPNATGFPQMMIDGEAIGGLTESVKYFVDKGLVTSKKK